MLSLLRWRSGLACIQAFKNFANKSFFAFGIIILYPNSGIIILKLNPKQTSVFFFPPRENIRVFSRETKRVSETQLELLRVVGFCTFLKVFPANL